MHTPNRLKAVVVILVAALATLPASAHAGPEPGARGRGFRIFARPLGALTINRIYCGLDSSGQVCADSLGSSTIGGGYWPKGTANQYVFNSGLQLAGIIGPDGGPWASDTTGAFFFDPKGTTPSSEQVQPIYNTQSASDNAFICGIGSFGCNSGTTDPVALAARVPAADANANLYNQLLQGRTAASQGDVWWLSWDGNPGLLAGRPHPLGVVVEQRGLGWNFPSGNEDIIYFIYTFYNVTSINPADYAAVRPGMREILIQQANTFQQRNEATFGISLPDGGYTITNMFANFSADMDVGSATQNYASVNVPFALGYTYENTFSRFAGWTFDPAIFGAPFFAGTGFVGVKYLKSPVVNGQEVGLSLFSNTTNGGGDLNDPRDVKQLYRYVSGTLSPAFGDGACNFNPQTDKICFIRTASPFDMRFFQSSGPLTLAPGEFGSVVVAYLFAAPVATGGSAACPTCDIKPGNAAITANLDDPNVVASGVNPIDSITGFLSATDGNGDGVLTQEEFVVVPGSLLGKAKVAQAVFDNQFLLPFAPDAPEFFLIPGDNQVTVMWRPSPSEQGGDPFYAIASQATVLCDPDDVMSGQCPNPLYDPNYREFDVEGYRVYRGRVDAPNALRLLAQFDQIGTVISDYAGQIQPSALCAPELGVTTNCPIVYDPIAPGLPRSAHVDVPLVGAITQVKLGDRALLANNEAIILSQDITPNSIGSAGSCAPSICPALSDTGVPFVYVDNTVRNNFRYFYSVTAFDINSFQSGPSNLESARVTKPVTPVRPAGNYANAGTLTSVTIEGRGVTLDHNAPLPTIDGATGQFSGPFPAASDWTIGFGDFVAAVLSQPGSFAAHLDSISLGSPYDGIPHLYWWTATSGNNSASFSVAILQTQEIGVRSGATSFSAVPADPALASRYGGGAGYTIPGQVGMSLPGPDYMTIYGRGCVNTRPGFAAAGECTYNGSRWFDGPSPANNETAVDPIAGNGPNFTAFDMSGNYNNAGALTGVTTIFQAQSYQAAQNTYRGTEGAYAAAKRAADFNLYWGAGGLIDSVIDVTHNVPVPFRDSVIGGSWGVLNQSAAQPSGLNISFDRRTELTATDMGCVEPLRSLGAAAQSPIVCGTSALGDGPQYILSNTVIPGPIAMFSLGSTTNARVSAAAANNGFVLYISGDVFTFELTGGAVPASGTVWSLRQYVGAISGGNGAAGDFGPYVYSNPEGVMPVTAVGVDLRASFDVVNQVNAPTEANLAQVHTVPDPYYVTSEFEQSTDTKVIKFVNLPQDAVVRIYSSSGVLVNLLEHHSTTFGGALDWNVRNRNNQVVASGVYFYHIESGNARRVGRFTIVNFAQ